MTRTYDPAVEQDAWLWRLFAAAIIGIQGLGTLLYATFLPAPLTRAGIDIPELGTMPFVWIAAGTISLVAAVGVAAGRSWGRDLGTVSIVSAMAFGLFNAQSAALGVVAFSLMGMVLFALWQKWPSESTIRAGELGRDSGQTPTTHPGSPDHLRVRPKDQAA